MSNIAQKMEKNEQNDDLFELTIPDPGPALRPAHKQTRITRKKKLEILEQLGKEFNLSKAAALAGIHRKALYYAINNDPTFKDAVDDVKEAWLDQSEGSGLRVAIQPTREGYNDRKLFLTAHRPETYAKQPEIQINQQFNFGQGEEIGQILQKITPKGDKSSP